MQLADLLATITEWLRWRDWSRTRTGQQKRDTTALSCKELSDFLNIEASLSTTTSRAGLIYMVAPHPSSKQNRKVLAPSDREVLHMTSLRIDKRAGQELRKMTTTSPKGTLIRVGTTLPDVVVILNQRAINSFKNRGRNGIRVISPSHILLQPYTTNWNIAVGPDDNEMDEDCCNDVTIFDQFPDHCQ